MARNDREAKIKKRIVDRIVGVDEASQYLRVLVYGRNKQGKTRFAASAPNVLILDVNEEGTKSARGYKGAKVVHIQKWEDIRLAYWYLKRGDHEFESIVIDTITALQLMCMTHVLNEEGEKDMNKDKAMPARRDWGKLAELMKHTLLDFRNLPMHVVFVAQERQLTDDDGVVLERVPDLSTANRSVALASVDIIGRIYQKEVRAVNKKSKKEVVKWETRMLVGPHEEYATGGRIDPEVLPRVVKNPTMPALIELVNKEE